MAGVEMDRAGCGGVCVCVCVGGGSLFDEELTPQGRVVSLCDDWRVLFALIGSHVHP